MSTEPSTRGERTTCEECGLPYYAGENDACPYCEHASEGTESSSTRTESDANPAGTNATNAESDESAPSVLRRISKRVREVLGSV